MGAGDPASVKQQQRQKPAATTASRATLAAASLLARRRTATTKETKTTAAKAHQQQQETAEPLSLGGVVVEGDGELEGGFVARAAVAAGGVQVGEGVKVRGGVVAGLITKVFAIERHELRKFLYMSVMMFAIIYVFTMTRCGGGAVRHCCLDILFVAAWLPLTAAAFVVAPVIDFASHLLLIQFSICCRLLR